MTEPETPGSDPTQLITRATKDGDGYVLNGHKWFTSNGSIAELCHHGLTEATGGADHQNGGVGGCSTGRR